MCVDLLEAHRRRRGWSQRDVARRLRVSEAYISYVFNPAPLPAMQKLLSREKERRLIDLLEIDAVGREVLQHHMAAARRGQSRPDPERAWLSPDEVEAARAYLRRLHGDATFACSAEKARRAYLQLWDVATRVADRIHPRHHQFARVQVLMYLHDVACVLNRVGLALRYARQASGILQQEPLDSRSRERFESSQVQAARAEIVALNNLGLPIAARAAAERVETELPGFKAQRARWLPQVCGDRLSSLSRLEGVRRFAISEAEILRERAGSEALLSPVMETLLDNGLAKAFLAHGSRRSLRKALPLVELGLRRAKDPAEVIGPLHRALLLRTAARYEWKTGGRSATWVKLMRQCLTIVDKASLTHQRAEIERQYGAEEIGKINVF